MSNAFIYRMPSGIPGDVTRREAARIEAQQLDASYPVLTFGVPVKMVSGKIRPMASGDTGQPYGFLVRPYPTQRTTNEALGAATPDLTQLCDVLVAGYMTVKAYGTAPAKNGSVYYLNQDLTGLLQMGRVETTSAGSPTTNVAITGARFMGTGDSDGNVEIGFNV